MAGIPPTSVGSIIQTQAAEARVAGHKARAAGVESERSGPTSFAEKLQDVIEATDRDSQVYSDAEGTGGGGGKDFGEPAGDQTSGEAGVAEDTGGLDVEA
jgi:hypothetical protein